MYVKNLDPSLITDIEYVGLRKEGKYLLPFVFKYVAWFIVALSVIASSTVLILYGISFGRVKSYLWLTGFFSSFLISLFISGPIRALIFTIISSFCMKLKPSIIKRKINPSLIENPPDPVKKKQLLKFRKNNAHLYNPTPLHKLQSRLEDIKYNLELRNLTMDMIVYSLFLAIGFYLVLFNKTPMAYYSNDAIFKVILNGSHTDTIHLDEIRTYDTFIQYLNKTFLPALLKNPLGKYYEIKPNKLNKRRKRSWHDTAENSTVSFKNIKVLNDMNNLKAGNGTRRKNIFSRGWTMNPNVKLLGKPRLRQIRVRSDSCKEFKRLKGRNYECAADLDLMNVERRNFTLKWEPYAPNGLTEMQKAPWIYRSGWESASAPVFAKFKSYPAGGYVLNLARNLEDARIILSFLDTFQWVDIKTRVIFLEFTLYCVNTNLFNIVTVIAEKPANGYIIPSYQIETCKFLFLEGEFAFLGLSMTVLYSFILFFLLLRESLRIHRTSFKQYMCRAAAVLDLSVIFLGVVSLVFVILRNNYVSDLLKRLEKAENNEFVSFIYAAVWHTWSVYVEALLVCLSSFKLLRLLMFRVVFFQIQSALSECYRRFIDLVFQLLVLIIAFSLFFNLALVGISEGFCSFGMAFSTMIGRTVVIDDSFDFSVFSKSSWYLSSFFFVLFVVLISIQFVNIFIAVVCLYFQKIRNVTLIDKYNVLEFLRHYLTLRRQNDLLPLREGKAFRRKNDEDDVMRLKGGGNSMRKMKKKKKKKQPKPKTEEVVEPAKIKLRDFVTKKPYDTTQYMDLSWDRCVALKNMMISILTDDEKVRETYNENSLKAMFCSFTANRRELYQEPGPYFFVAEQRTDTVFDSSVFIKMKKVVENVGREKDLLEDDVVDKIDASECKLTALEKKLSLVAKKLNSK